LISPYSIQSALAMAYAGADGQTREEMARVLHYGAEDAALHTAFGALRKTLEELVQVSEQSSQKLQQFRMTNDPIMLAVANRLFGQVGYDFREPFLRFVNETYEAPL